MGAWGTKILQNDKGLDFVVTLMRDGFKKATENEEYLVLADIGCSYNYVFSEEELNLIKYIIEEELNKLSNWASSERGSRKIVLTKLLGKVEKSTSFTSY